MIKQARVPLFLACLLTSSNTQYESIYLFMSTPKFVSNFGDIRYVLEINWFHRS